MPHNHSLKTVYLALELLYLIPEEFKITAHQLQRRLVAIGYKPDLRSISQQEFVFAWIAS